MALLIVGVLLFASAHLFPALAQTKRNRVSARLGAGPYQGLFSLVIIGSVIVIVLGWKTALPNAVYAPVLAPGPVTSGLMLIASVLFVASVLPTNLKRWIRHPQMTGTLLWSIAHLLANGDSRSIALFGGIGVWSILEILFCNRRDGAWQKPGPVSIGKDIAYVIVGIILFAVFAYSHRWLFGVTVMPATLS